MLKTCLREAKFMAPRFQNSPRTKDPCCLKILKSAWQERKMLLSASERRKKIEESCRFCSRIPKTCAPRIFSAAGERTSQEILCTGTVENGPHVPSALYPRGLFLRLDLLFTKELEGELKTSRFFYTVREQPYILALSFYISSCCSTYIWIAVLLFTLRSTI